MRAGDVLKEVLYTAVVALMLVGLWVLAYARSMNALVAHHWWPPKDPILARRVLESLPPEPPDDAVQDKPALAPVSALDVNNGD